MQFPGAERPTYESLRADFDTLRLELQRGLDPAGSPWTNAWNIDIAVGLMAIRDRLDGQLNLIRQLSQRVALLDHLPPV
jgi:hypothetical protein